MAQPDPAFPEELVCVLCHFLLEDAVMLPCCASSVCEICARERIAGTKCPMQDCESTEADPGDLIPNRRLRAKTQIYRDKHNVPLRERTPPMTTDDEEAKDSLKTLLSILPNSNRSPEPEEIEAVQNELLSEPVPSREPTIDFETAKATSKEEMPVEEVRNYPSDVLSKDGKEEIPNGTSDASTENANGTLDPTPQVSRDKNETESAHLQNVDDEEEPLGDAIPTISHGVEIPRELMKEAVHDPLAAFNKLMQVRDKEKGIVNAEQHYGQAPPQYDKDAIYNATYAHKGYYHNSHMYGGQPKRCFTCNKVGHLDKHCRFNPQSINYMPSSHSLGRNHRDESEYYRSHNESSFRKSQSRERSRRSRSRRISGSGDEKRTRRSRSPFGKSGKTRSQSRSRSRSASRKARKRSRSASPSKSVARKRYRSRSRSKQKRSQSRSPSRRKSRSSSRSRKSPKRSEKRKKKRERSSSRETKKEKRKKDKKDRRFSRDETPPKKKKKSSMEKSPEHKPEKEKSSNESERKKNNSVKSEDEIKEKSYSSGKERDTSPEDKPSSRVKVKKSPERSSVSKIHHRYNSSSSRDGPGVHFRDRKSTTVDIQTESRRSQTPPKSSSKEPVVDADISDEPFFTPSKFANSKIEIKLGAPKSKVVESKPEFDQPTGKTRLESIENHPNGRRSSPSAKKGLSKRFRDGQSSSPSPPRKTGSSSKSKDKETWKKQSEEKNNPDGKHLLSDKPAKLENKILDHQSPVEDVQKEKRKHSPKRRSRSRTPKRKSRSRTPKRKGRSKSPKGRSRLRSPADDRSARKSDQSRDEIRAVGEFKTSRELSPIEETHLNERQVQIIAGSKIGDSISARSKKKKKKAKNKGKKSKKISSESEEDVSSSSSSSSSSESSENSSDSDSSDEKNSVSKKLKRKKKRKSKKSKKKSKKRAKAKKSKAMDILLEQGSKVAKIRLTESDLQDPKYLQQILIQQLNQASKGDKPSGNMEDGSKESGSQEPRSDIKTKEDVLELGKSSSIELKINIVNSSCDTKSPISDKTTPHLAQVQGAEEDEEDNSEHEESGPTMAFIPESQAPGDN
ncbi:hypothetical protein TCAL_14606 [Tigriopus californicus]|uniref:CCHC-type domain-containing protein n=1 Tax=Tigriopus californicus TaxID=6832 RepID=A0A553PDC7_TIGCA|nr:serine/arginine repetitive matrix protein 2-like [Tigriopus californicus]TRY75679.1 hypothetical protein TCAL_14606 [Tigriopus californicus]